MRGGQAPTGELIVCPTPIGNLGDVSLRALEALGAADLVACEDTRHTRVLLERHAIRAELVSYHGHNERRRAAELAGKVRDGARVVLVSDAGTPVISDPGYQLVRACIDAGLALTVLPGPNAAITALVASGLPPDRFTFTGFLPRVRGELERVLAEAGGTLVAYESPRRLAATLALAAAREPARPGAVCRELTKMHEEVRRGSVAALAEHYAATPARGEVVLVLGAPAAADGERERALEALRELVQAGARPRPAAAAIARLSGIRANELYRALTAG